MLPEKIIFVAISLNLVSYFLYIRSIIKGNAKPNLVSWFVWMLAPFVGVFFAIKAGAGLSILPVFMAGFGPLIIIIAAVLTKNALWKITLFDVYCGLLAIMALIIYIFTHSLAISIFFAIFSDALAFIPTMIKGWKFPETESIYPYSFSIFSNIIGLLIIKNWSFSIYSFSIYLIVFNLALTGILLRRKIFKTQGIKV